MVKSRNAYKILVGNPEGKRPLQRPRHRLEIILKWILSKYVGRMWSGFIQYSIGPTGGLTEP
jgi:hypothetical protein